MDYLKLAELYDRLEKTTKRLVKTEILAEFLKKLSERDIKQVVYLLEGLVFPKSDERKLGMSSQLIIKVLSISRGISNDKVVNEWKKIGDLGELAERLEKKQRTLGCSKLTVDKVFNNLQRLAGLEGKGTVNKKIGLVSELLSNANPLESKYIVRTVIGDLRIGVAEGIMRDAIAKAFHADIKDVEKATNFLTDYSGVIDEIKKGGLKKIGIMVGVPFKVMLGPRVESIKEAFEAVGRPCQFEEKLDGFRLTIHKDNDIKLFTRRLENVTRQFPDVVDVVKKNIKAKSCILDTEAVGYDKKTGNYLPFQMISQRIKRKYDIEKTAKEFPVVVNIFDIVYLNGRSLVNEKLKDRRRLLEGVIKPIKMKIVLTKKIVTGDEEKAMDFYKCALKKGLEGVMIKNINSTYVSGRRVGGWVKFKPTLEPLDLVITGATYGTGKRANMLSSFVLCCKSGNKFLECGMMGTGIKEKGEGVTFKGLTRLLKKDIIEVKGRDVRIRPRVVIEVSYEEIQKSPTYNSGFALRFPKFQRLRTEKPVSEINTLKDLEGIYKKQRGRG